MIDPRVELLASEFASFWTRVFQEYPRYQLDLSWPSVGTIDYLLFPLRRKKTLSAVERRMVQGAAAYLGVMARDCWSKISKGGQASVSFVPESGDVLLRIDGGSRLRQGDYFAVAVSKVLEKILQHPPNPFPAFEKAAFSVVPESNMVGLFAAGLFSGLCPYGAGAWRKESLAGFAEALAPVHAQLAAMCAAYYRNLYPTEQLGADSRLYYGYLIFPPPGFEEKFPALRAAGGILEFLRSINASTKQMAEVGLHLATFTDELISSAGFALAAALYDEHPHPKLKAIAAAAPERFSLLRPAVMLVRTMLGKEESWLELRKIGKTDDAQRLLHIERELGLVPLVHMNGFSGLEHPLLDDVLEALCWRDAAAAREIMKRFRMLHDITAEFLLQEIYLSLLLGDFPEVEEQLKFLGSREEHLDISELLDCHLLNARFLKAQGKNEEARKAFTDTFAIAARDQDSYFDAGRELALLEYQIGNNNRAQEILKEIILLRPERVHARLLYAALLRESGAEEEFAEEMPRLIMLSPNSRQVFALLVETLIAKSKELPQE